MADLFNTFSPLMRLRNVITLGIYFGSVPLCLCGKISFNQNSL